MGNSSAVALGYKILICVHTSLLALLFACAVNYVKYLDMLFAKYVKVKCLHLQQIGKNKLNVHHSDLDICCVFCKFPPRDEKHSLISSCNNKL